MTTAAWGSAVGYGAWQREVDMESEASVRLVTLALRGGPRDVERLIRELLPVIHARAARMLMGAAGGAHRNLREEVEDAAQEVLALLFADDGRVLRAWSPDKGLSLRNFVGLVAQRKVGAILAARKRNPWWEAPMEADAIARALPSDGAIEETLAAKEVLEVAVRKVAETQTERGRHLLQRIVVDGADMEALRAETGMADAALYQWKSRLSKAVGDAVRALLAEGDTSDPGEER
jgi:RNA polymerase sigma-70 factor (ECF subfamily)